MAQVQLGSITPTYFQIDRMSQIREQHITKIEAIRKFLNFTTYLFEEVLAPLKTARNVNELEEALKVSKRAFAKQLIVMRGTPDEFVDTNDSFKLKDKPTGWDDLLELSQSYKELSGIAPVTSQAETQTAFDLHRLLQRFIRRHDLDELSLIADSHTNGATRSWFFEHVMRLIAASSVDPARLHYMTKFFGEITDPSYRNAALDTLSHCHFKQGGFMQGFWRITTMPDPKDRQSSLEKSLNLFSQELPAYSQHCLIIAAFLRDVKRDLPQGTSTLAEGVQDLENPELKEKLMPFLGHLR